MQKLSVFWQGIQTFQRPMGFETFCDYCHTHHCLPPAISCSLPTATHLVTASQPTHHPGYDRHGGDGVIAQFWRTSAIGRQQLCIAVLQPRPTAAPLPAARACPTARAAADGAVDRCSCGRPPLAEPPVERPHLTPEVGEEWDAVERAFGMPIEGGPARPG